MASITMANTFICQVNPNTNLNPQMQSCRIAIIKHECEQLGITVNSNTTVSNNTITTDNIKTSSNCSNISIHATNVKLINNQLHVIYDVINKNNQVRTVSMEQWMAIDPINNTSKINKTTVHTDSNNTIIKIDGELTIESKPVMDVYDRWADKTRRIIQIIKEN